MTSYNISFRLNSFENLSSNEVEIILRNAFEDTNIYDEVNNEINDFEIEDELEDDGE
jgi:hypothetical protein